METGASIPLVVGLGNPGRQYENTRHNVGFMVLERLALLAGVPFESKPKWQSHVAKLPGSGVLLVKPQSFMNLSGRPVRQITTFHKWTPEQVLVVYDDVSLPLGKLRFRERGSAGGHNGIKSMIEHLGGDAFPRLKVGIGASEPGNMTGHVLGTFREDEREALENTLARAVAAVQLALSQGLTAAAGFYNSNNGTT
ncbi:aminoacyl-tRNA hydrolase [Luteolibacter flavescens]|uniref:Peptidyl-tRNA hydrolase n=1 Tax=Luteolibacter flavescens TaxID=1859460 RepID=A0ABT3FT75_9BACT|nr:aminoacyl-tRNA hydrolase [Luteolibacter flavescens]MCW1886764.1 aminoacyl-tRNA hydrolase [Luteolibacter flavescens]